MKDIQYFNQTLLEKQVRRILNIPHCLLAGLLKSRYFSYCDFLQSVEGSRPSFVWKSILYGRDLLAKRLKLKLGNGNSMIVWTDKWIEDVKDEISVIKNCLIDISLRVDQLIDFRTGRWKINCLEELFHPSDLELILNLLCLKMTSGFGNTIEVVLLS